MKKAILTIEFASIAMMAAFAVKMEKAGYDLKDAETDTNETGATTVKGTATTAAKKETAPAEKAEKPAAKAPAAKKTEAKAAAPADKKSFKDATEEEQLEAIRTIVTRHSKKGSTAEIKQILNVYGVSRAGELAVEDYEPAYRMLVRFNGGESIDTIVPQDAGDEGNDDLL